MGSTRTRVKPDTEGWVETAQATNAAATATRAAETGRKHYITGVNASFSAAAAGIQLTVRLGSTEVYREYIHNSGGMSFAGIEGNEGETVSAELSAGGATVVGSVNLDGYTI